MAFKIWSTSCGSRVGRTDRCQAYAASTVSRFSSARIKKAQTGPDGGDLEKAEVARLVAPLSHSASRVFSPMPVPACLLVAPEESFTTVHRLPLMPLLTTSATTCLPFPFLVSAGACPSMEVA